MQKRWQFSTQNLLLEFSLIAIGLGLARLAWTSFNHNPISEAIFFPLSVYGMLACFGAAIGGLFGRRLSGVLWTFGGTLVGYVLIAAGMVVYAVVFA